MTQEEIDAYISLGLVRDVDLEDRMERFQGVVKAIRHLLQEHGVRGKAPLLACVFCENLHAYASLWFFEHLFPTVLPSHITIHYSEDPWPIDVQTLVTVYRDYRITIDGAQVAQKPSPSSRSVLTEKIAQSKAKLANQQFVTNAKPEIVARERQRLQEYEAALGLLQNGDADANG